MIPKPIGPHQLARLGLWLEAPRRLRSVVAAIWFPIAAKLTPAHVADSDPASDLLGEVPAEDRFVLGDRHYNVPKLHSLCDQQDRLLVITRYGRYPHTDAGVEVRDNALSCAAIVLHDVFQQPNTYRLLLA